MVLLELCGDTTLGSAIQTTSSKRQFSGRWCCREIVPGGPTDSERPQLSTHLTARLGLDAYLSPGTAKTVVQRCGAPVSCLAVEAGGHVEGQREIAENLQAVEHGSEGRLLEICLISELCRKRSRRQRTFKLQVSTVPVIFILFEVGS